VSIDAVSSTLNPIDNTYPLTLVKYIIKWHIYSSVNLLNNAIHKMHNLLNKKLSSYVHKCRLIKQTNFNGG